MPVAAMQPDIHARVRFVMSVGGYYDLHNVIAYFTTGYANTGAALTVDGTRAGELRSPHPYSEAVFIRSNLDLLERPVDRGFMNSYANYLVDTSAEVEEPSPGTLAPDALAFYRLLINHDPSAVPRLIEDLSGGMRRLIEGLKVAFEDGVVSLSGSAAGPAAMEKAVLMAGNVSGVTEVKAEALTTPATSSSAEE